MNRLLPILAVPAFLLAACSSGTGSSASATPETTTPGTTTTATVEPSPDKTTGTPRCHTGDLSVKTGTGDGAAGTYHTDLVFTDKSDHRCTLYGYPGVSWVTGDNGTQVNDPFERSSGTKRTITLSPGGQAHAVLVTHAALNYPADKCKPVDVRGYRVYPPDETAAVFVSAPGKQCSVKGTNLGQVQPLASGPGRSGD